MVSLATCFRILLLRLLRCLRDQLVPHTFRLRVILLKQARLAGAQRFPGLLQELSLRWNHWGLSRTCPLQCLLLLGLDSFFWIFVVERLARFLRRPFATSWHASVWTFFWTLPMTCFRTFSTSPCCDGASVAFFFFFALAGPPCGDFSRAKLRPGGPKPLRTPEFPFGVPGLSDRDQRRVECSRTLLHRVVQILLAVFSTGGHVCLEQPSSAFSWQDPSVQDFLAETAAVCSVVPACCFGLNMISVFTQFCFHAFISHTATSVAILPQAQQPASCVACSVFGIFKSQAFHSGRHAFSI